MRALRCGPSATVWILGLTLGVLLLAGAWRNTLVLPAPELLASAPDAIGSTAEIEPISPPTPALAGVIGQAQAAAPDAGTDAVITPVVASAPPGSDDVLTPVAEPTRAVAEAVARASIPTSIPGAMAQVTVAPATNEAATRATRVAGVPILMYHYVRVNPVASDKTGFNLSVTPADFEQQMRLLGNHGYTTVTMAQVREYVRNGTPLPAKPVALTFDDGYGDAFSAALPVLQRYHQVATFYIVTGFVGQAHYLTWDQVLTLDHAGMEIGSHTVNHVGLPFLSGLKRQYELSESRKTLEQRLGHPVLDFCYPNGEVNATVEIGAAQAGYLSATTTATGLAAPGADPLRLPRLRIWGGMSLMQFGSILAEKLMSADVLPPPSTSTPTVALPPMVSRQSAR
jgi:peptidoglycan/xylan/chitin deacetylase (PgdA/CDA1 family)